MDRQRTAAARGGDAHHRIKTPSAELRNTCRMAQRRVQTPSPQRRSAPQPQPGQHAKAAAEWIRVRREKLPPQQGISTPQAGAGAPCLQTLVAMGEELQATPPCSPLAQPLTLPCCTGAMDDHPEPSRRQACMETHGVFPAFAGSSRFTRPACSQQPRHRRGCRCEGLPARGLHLQRLALGGVPEHRTEHRTEHPANAERGQHTVSVRGGAAGGETVRNQGRHRGAPREKKYGTDALSTSTVHIAGSEVSILTTSLPVDRPWKPTNAAARPSSLAQILQGKAMPALRWL